MSDHVYNIVVMGHGGVGKSALTIQMIQGYFLDEYEPTISDTYRKQMRVDDTEAFVEILDTAGQEEYYIMLDGYLRGGEGFIFVYSIINRRTFEGLSRFMNALERSKEDEDSQPMVICANKLDLEKHREVTTAEGKEYADSKHASFFEASALTGKNVQELFHQIVRNVRAYRLAHPKPVKVRRTSTIGSLSQCLLF